MLKQWLGESQIITDLFRRRKKAVGVTMLFFLTAMALVYHHITHHALSEKANTSLKNSTRIHQGSNVNRERSGHHTRLAQNSKISTTDNTSGENLEVIDGLKELERSRGKYCREYENDGKIVNEFIISPPNESELKKMNELISQAKGSTWDDEHIVTSWQDKLRNDYLLPSEYDNYILTVTYDTNSKRGYYSLIGVNSENLVMRNGNAPMATKDQFIHKFQVGFSFDSNWRFSKLLKLDDSP